MYSAPRLKNYFGNFHYNRKRNGMRNLHHTFNFIFYYIYHFLNKLKIFQTETLIKIKTKHLKKRNSSKNKNRLNSFQQIYEDYRQKKIDRKCLVSYLSYR